MSRSTQITAAAAVSFLLLSLFAGSGAYSLNAQLSEARHQLRDLGASLASAAVQTAKDSANIADAARRAAETHIRDSLTRTLTPRLAERAHAATTADSVVLAAPDTCAPVIAALQEEVAATQHVADTYLALWTHEAAARDSASRALFFAQHALSEAHRALAASATKAASIEIPHPSWLTRILPQPSLGCTAGLSPITAQADIVCGASLGWKVSL